MKGTEQPFLFRAERQGGSLRRAPHPEEVPKIECSCGEEVTVDIEVRDGVKHYLFRHGDITVGLDKPDHWLTSVYRLVMDSHEGEEHGGVVQAMRYTGAPGLK